MGEHEDYSIVTPLPDGIEPCGEGALIVNDDGQRCVAIDARILPAVQALWAAGIKTRASCDGHGGDVGYVLVEIPGGDPNEWFAIFTKPETEALHADCETMLRHVRAQRNVYNERACRAEAELEQLRAHRS